MLILAVDVIMYQHYSSLAHDQYHDVLIIDPKIKVTVTTTVYTYVAT